MKKYVNIHQKHFGKSLPLSSCFRHYLAHIEQAAI
nr:MAG TPA: hypothetical protein [Caudoviricetes sp.]